ncbi:hypothetical protein MTR67_049060 [Solanum verrucosum]|uniref:Reverse transcriptase domain-containing protein n=1 Tax=Solanum verrucosum TaxID=315347 RepID=A0AAF0UZJ7_SOLVR|nr:hypothetical protein MTR67_049060 [Solanum verrucosum]
MVMPRVTSDHCPILLQCGDWEKQRPYFKFKNWWLEIDGFRELVHKWWNEFEVIGSPDYVLSLKLRMLKKKITEWSKLACGGLDIKKRNFLAELADIDLVQDTRALNEDEMIKAGGLLLGLLTVLESPRKIKSGCKGHLLKLRATLLANELVDSKVKQNVPGVLCKLDIEKAYDHVNWVFLLKILRDMGFGNKWINWINFCISTVKFSLIINGSPEGFFQSQRGLRQGDPMSPFLFILAMEGLNFMIRRARENGWIRGFCANRTMGNAMEISHLLYADDSLVFCEAEVTQIRHLRAILTIFEGVSGLHINWQKSCLYPVNQVPNMQILAENLGCQVASLPTKYLGMPLGAKNKELEVWNEIL